MMGEGFGSAGMQEPKIGKFLPKVQKRVGICMHKVGMLLTRLNIVVYNNARSRGKNCSRGQSRQGILAQQGK